MEIGWVCITAATVKWTGDGGSLGRFSGEVRWGMVCIAAATVRCPGDGGELGR